MRILISNDDGIDAYGLSVLEKMARQISNDVMVVAPMDNRSGAGQSITLTRDLHLAKIDASHYACSGSPADCVMLALNLLYETGDRPDLVLSGINHGMNAADDVGYSGTIGVAREAAIYGIPSIAFSQHGGRVEADFGPAEACGGEVLAYCLQNLPDPRSLLNVNFPSAKTGKLKGIRPADLDHHKVSDEILETDIPHHYRIGPLVMRPDTDPASDRDWLRKGYVTITPIGLNATDKAQLARLPQIDFDLKATEQNS